MSAALDSLIELADRLPDDDPSALLSSDDRAAFRRLVAQVEADLPGAAMLLDEDLTTVDEVRSAITMLRQASGSADALRKGTPPSPGGATYARF